MAWTDPHVFGAGELENASLFNQYIRDILNVLYPVGSYIYMHRAPTSGETTVMGKFLECNGASVSTTTYSALNGVIGSTYGTGGAGLMNLPDLHGRTLQIVARSGGHTDVTTLGNSDGVAIGSRRPKHAHTVSADSHTHSVSGNTGIESVPHTHTYTLTAFTTHGGAFPVAQHSGSQTTANTSTESSLHNHTLTTSLDGNSQRMVGPTAGDAPVDAPGYLVGGAWFIAYV